ncbi:MAG: hypothetical protein EP349_08330 [Alphaproteobacteria bacterium]|nr:MAG: hypothetical protein EP349_08330 [Alphaproteobacteria bacterium]
MSRLMGQITDLQTERLKQLEKKLNTLLRQSDISDSDFAQAVYDIVSSGAVSEQQLRNEFGLTGGAVTRWTTGKNLPQPDIRPIILRWALSVLAEA